MNASGLDVLGSVPNMFHHRVNDVTTKTYHSCLKGRLEAVTSNILAPCFIFDVSCPRSWSHRPGYCRPHGRALPPAKVLTSAQFHARLLTKAD